jgi:hypothetical protein
MQCGFCDSCHWKKERLEKIKQSHQLKQKLLRYTVKKQNRDQQFIIGCLSCCYLLQHVYQSYAPDSLSCSFTPHPISLANIVPTRDSTDNSARSLIFSWLNLLISSCKRGCAKSEQSSRSGKAKKLEKIIIVDNKEKTIAEEEPSPYNGSTIDNNSAFTQLRGRDAIQPIQKEQDEDVLEGGDGDGDEACSRSQESEEASVKVPIRELEHLLASAEIKFTILRIDTRK